MTSKAFRSHQFKIFRTSFLYEYWPTVETVHSIFFPKWWKSTVILFIVPSSIIKIFLYSVQLGLVITLWKIKTDCCLYVNFVNRHSGIGVQSIHPWFEVETRNHRPKRPSRGRQRDWRVLWRNQKALLRWGNFDVEATLAYRCLGIGRFLTVKSRSWVPPLYHLNLKAACAFFSCIN